MATPRADIYSAASGGAIYAGMAAPSATPTWLAAMSVGTWGQISGTAGPVDVPTFGAGLKPNAYSGFALKPSTSELFAVATGGHDDSPSNAAASIKLSDNAPAWTIRRQSSWNGTDNGVTYYSDGSPCSRHTYYHNHYIASEDAVVMAGCRYGYQGGTTLPGGGGMDLFDLNSNNYRARYTWPDIPDIGTYGFGCALDGAGNLWTMNGYKFTVSTKTWSKPGTGTLARYPAEYDSIRDRIFALQWGDGEDPGSTGVVARELDPNAGNSRNITFNASAAYTQFQADKPLYAGMAYCPLDGKFYFMHPGRIGTFYVVTPNASAVWDMAIYTPGGSVPAAPPQLCRRLLWVPSLSGFVLQSTQFGNLSFLRMA